MRTVGTPIVVAEDETSDEVLASAEAIVEESQDAEADSSTEESQPLES